MTRPGLLADDELRTLFALFDGDGRGRIPLSDVYAAVESVVGDAAAVAPFLPRDDVRRSATRLVDFAEFREIVIDILCALQRTISQQHNEEHTTIVDDSPIEISDSDNDINANDNNNSNNNDDDDDDDELQMAITMSLADNSGNDDYKDTMASVSELISNDETPLKSSMDDDSDSVFNENSVNDSSDDDYSSSYAASMSTSAVASGKRSKQREGTSTPKRRKMHRKEKEVDPLSFVNDEVISMFNLFDTQHRGYIAIEDLFAANDRLLKDDPLHPDRLQDMFRLADVNNDGTIDVGEFVNILRNKYVNLV